MGDALSLLGGLATLAPAALGTLWLLAHGVPVGVQDAAALSGLPLVGPALAEAPLRVGLLGTWPFGAGYRLLLLGPVVGLVAGGMLAARGAPRADRWMQGAMIAVPYTLMALLVALLARVTVDLTLAGASLSTSLGASLPWLLLLLPAGAVLGALGGHTSRFGDEVPAARPRLAFLSTAAVCALVLLLSVPVLFGSGPPAGQELLGSAVPREGPPELPAFQEEPLAEPPPPEPPELDPPPSEPEAAPPEQPQGGPTQAGLGESLTVGEARWLVVKANKRTEIRPQDSDEVRQGDFVVVNFEFTNDSGGPVSVRPSSMGLVAESGRRFEVMADLPRYVPPERNLFSQPVGPGATLEGKAIFVVTPKASGFRLQLGDGQPLPPENVYVDLGL